MPEEKQYTRQVTERFLREMDRIVGYNKNGKITQYEFGEKVGITPNNLVRLRKGGNHFVTIEACCRLCENYGTDRAWLLMGEEPADKVHSNGLNDRLKNMEEKITRIDKKISDIIKPPKPATEKKFSGKERG
jgi:transcriptional regulator with XRE-family HTH domain